MTVTIAAKAPVPAPAPGRDRHPASWPEPRPPGHLAGADALRAFAALAVIVVHATHWPLQNTGADAAVWNGITLMARFSVPAFLLLAGMVLAYRYGEQRLGGAFLLRRARRSVVPLLVWAPLFFLFGLLATGEIHPSASSMRDWWSGGGGHLYFLVLIPQFYLLLMIWPSHRRTAVALAVALLAVQVGLDTYRLYAPISGTPARQLMLVHGYEEFPFWIGYFAVGVAAGRVLAARRGRGLPAWPFLAAIPVAAAALLWPGVGGAANAQYGDGTGAFLRPLMVPFALAVCGAVVFGGPALLARTGWLRRASAVVSRHSLGMYIVHPMLLAGLGRLLHAPLHAHLPLSILPVLLMATAAATGALLVTALLARTPLAVIVGEQRTRAEPERVLRGRAQQRRRVGAPD